MANVLLYSEATSSPRRPETLPYVVEGLSTGASTRTGQPPRERLVHLVACDDVLIEGVLLLNERT